jgi:Spy/CpxP family protein refolding chaperone
MKLKVWITVLSFLTVMNLAALGALLLNSPDGRPRDSRGRGFEGRRGGRDNPRLELRREEREQMRQLMDTFRNDTRDLRQRADQLEDRLVEMMSEDTVDSLAIDSLLLDLSAVRLEIGRKATANLIAAKQFLSPRQQEMFYRAVLGVRPGGPPPGERPGGKRRRG